MAHPQLVCDLLCCCVDHPQVAWFDAGKFEYFAPASTLFIVQMILFAWVEIRRYQDYLAPGTQNQVSCTALHTALHCIVKTQTHAVNRRPCFVHILQ
jgi:hypothetical protein